MILSVHVILTLYVVHVFIGEVETATEVSENWRKCHAIAQILSSCPKQVKSVGEYYMLVCPQV